MMIATKEDHEWQHGCASIELQNYTTIINFSKRDSPNILAIIIVSDGVRVYV